MKSRIELQFAFCRAFWNRFILFANFALYFFSLSFLFLLLPMIRRYISSSLSAAAAAARAFQVSDPLCCASLHNSRDLGEIFLCLVCCFCSLEYIFLTFLWPSNMRKRRSCVDDQGLCICRARFTAQHSSKQHFFHSFFFSSFHWNILKKKTQRRVSVISLPLTPTPEWMCVFSTRVFYRKKISLRRSSDDVRNGGCYTQ